MEALANEQRANSHLLCRLPPFDGKVLLQLERNVQHRFDLWRRIQSDMVDLAKLHQPELIEEFLTTKDGG